MERYAISPDGRRTVGWPLYDAEQDAEIDFFAELAEHLDERDIAVLMEVGWEKLRYLIGEAIAINSNGRAICVSLDEIYEKAKHMIGEDAMVTEATY